MTNLPDILTVDQVADHVQLSTKTVMRAIARGDLRASQLADKRGGWRIRTTDIDTWLEARANHAPQPRPIADVRPIHRPSQRCSPGGSRNPAPGGTLTVTPDMGRAHDPAV